MRLEGQSVKRGLLWTNEKKTKYMEWTDEEYQEGRFLKVETDNSNGRSEFTYLGSIFSRKPNIGEEIETRIMAGNKCVAGVEAVLSPSAPEVLLCSCNLRVKWIFHLL
ncbi:hypothetical protein NQ315_014662 [Exocentrus adspersus]|uniref:Uncharacterized protein n=1 Tax=Exocentrus adspersus TaxID=1586481 RepID=A0AAV8VQD1_9CUCU|nr:hypothetical protein NQ315_014662 [Exocentrus adspersus]